MSLGDDLGFPPEIFSYQADETLVLPRCRMGLEFEFERVRVPLNKTEGWMAYWQSKKDGSLHDNGVEYVFTVPLFGKDVLAAVHGLLTWAALHGFAISIRTGLHGHLDVRDMTLPQLRMLCTIYALYERAVYNHVGNNREENVFCYPWFAAQGAVDVVKWIVNAEGPGALKESSKALAQEKYAGLNLDALARFGSIEFRHALTSLDYDWVFNWINIIQRFKEAAIRITDDPKSLVEFVSRDPVMAAKMIFQEQSRFLVYPELEKHVIETGVPTALDLIIHNVSWDMEIEGENEVFKAFMEQNKPKRNKAKAAGYSGMIVDDIVPTVRGGVNTPIEQPETTAQMRRRVLEQAHLQTFTFDTPNLFNNPLPIGDNTEER